MRHPIIKRLLQYVAGFVFGFFPGKPGLFRVLTLHSVTDGHALDKVLRYLVETFDVITPGEAEALIAGKTIAGAKGKIPYLITFDDGFRCHGRMIKDLLAEYDIKAIFFICPGLMEMPVEAQRGAVARLVFDPPIPEAKVGVEQLPLSWEEAEGLLRAGHTIGSHTLSHKRLINLDDETLESELAGSAALITEKLKVTADWFAFPFGDIKSIDERAFKSARRQYRFLCSNIPAANLPKTSPLILFRAGFDLHSPFIFQRMIMAGGFYLRTARNARLLLEMVRRSV